jgi:hypothetical protein
MLSFALGSMLKAACVFFGKAVSSEFKNNVQDRGRNFNLKIIHNLNSHKKY